MANETKPLPISKELRRAVLCLVQDVIDQHPEANTDVHLDGVLNACRPCYDVAEALRLLEEEQREHGPAIDVTDPAWLREHPSPSKE